MAVMLRSRDVSELTAPSYRVKARGALGLTRQAGKILWPHRSLLMAVHAERGFIMTCLTLQAATTRF